MNELEVFKNEDFGEVRTVLVDGEPMFCLADVCRILDISNSKYVSWIYRG
jgi:prophage antirepressor-like protein